jgi:hypothetical protein
VENPIPFADSLATRVRTTALLHARYMGLLLAPLQLSADWSFACIPLVESWRDPRNLAGLALYLWLAWCGLSARPVSLVRGVAAMVSDAFGGASGAAAQAQQPEDAVARNGLTPATAAARWRLFVVAGLLVGPYFPASNVLFYVGTFIGERLLYMPSLGYCLLLAHLLGTALPLGYDGSKDAASTAAPARRGAGGRGRLLLLALVVAPLLAFYGARTWLRNEDWRDEERLFVSALAVCPNSAKVQLNSGILMRRHQRFGDALAHFRCSAGQLVQ